MAGPGNGPPPRPRWRGGGSGPARHWLTASQLRKVAAESDVLVHAVTIGGQAASVLEDLSALAETTGGRVWSAESSQSLDRTFLRILEEMHTRYLLAFEPGPAAREGWHRLTLKVKGGKGEVRSRRGYVLSR